MKLDKDDLITFELSAFLGLIAISIVCGFFFFLWNVILIFIDLIICLISTI